MDNSSRSSDNTTCSWDESTCETPTATPNDTANFSDASGLADKNFALSTMAQVSIPLYVTIFALSVVGNALVIVTLMQNKRMRTVTNVFLLNLAVSDLLLGVFCMPFTLVGTLLREFIFGEAMCKAIPYLQAVSVSVSAWTLVAISLERYFAICHPLRSRRWQTLSHAYKSIGLVWLGSFIIMIPIASLSHLLPVNNNPARLKCRETWPNKSAEIAFNLFLDGFLLLLPLVIMTSAYSFISWTLWLGMRNDTQSQKAGEVNNKSPSADGTQLLSNGLPTLIDRDSSRSFDSDRPPTPKRHSDIHRSIRNHNYERNLASKRRIIRMLFALVLEFFICWTPLYVINTIAAFSPTLVYKRFGSLGVLLVQLLTYISSCCNPITYCFMHQKFREAFVSAFGCRTVSKLFRGRDMSETETSFNFSRQNTLITGDSFSRSDTINSFA